MNPTLEMIGGTITMILFALLAWLFLITTPDQCSAEEETATTFQGGNN